MRGGTGRLVRAKLEREIDRLHALADAAIKRRIVLHPDPRAYWTTADFEQRRELVRLAVDRVTVMPARPGIGRFDPSRVRLELAVSARVHRPAAMSSPLEQAVP